ncbi:uncharacterized protein LOC126831840 isoform X1 [Patella vulgata]|uniref:uncharacterized protein LOC126831840 isoform X1 n=2 Tax=Patella vulgata TaxID=6465 RepID=UPI0021801D34|nr:uncharacterized protein LOC126831840 isoform X1 [Patella vulgata]
MFTLTNLKNVNCTMYSCNRNNYTYFFDYFRSYLLIVMSSFLDDIKSAKLKKSAHATKDYSSPKLAGFTSSEEIKEYQNAVLDVNTELWQECLKEVTFPSKYCPISIEEAETFVRIFERMFKNLDAERISKIDLWGNLTPEEKIVIDNLSSKLDVVLQEVIRNSKEGCAFVKTSSRSPKDAPMAHGKFGELYKSYLSKLSEEERNCENQQIICLLKSAFEAMKVTSAREVMQLMITSERIYQDMLLALEIKDRYHENFVVREFVPIDVDMEFRAFVFDLELTAIAQYNYLVFSDRLLKEKDVIIERLQKFYKEEVKTRITTKFPQHFIVDFAVCKDKIWVIEINPFLVSTDSGLFSWEHERHLLEGKEGFQFRIVEKAKPGAKTMLPSSVKCLLSKT